MSRFKSTQATDDFVSTLDEWFPDDGRIISVNPPKSSGGLESSVELLRSLHTLEEKGLFGKNVSPVCGMEIWYDSESLQFMFYVPNEERELHYRKQITGYFRGSEIVTRADKHVEINPGDYISGAEVQLAHHFFEPIRNPEGIEEMEFDPYQSLLSEIATKDESRTLIQILFRPAQEEWTSTPRGNVYSYAESLRQPHVETKWFGMSIKEVAPKPEEEKAADKIEQQPGRPAFHVNMRFITVSEDREKCEKNAHNIANALNVGYKEVNGQTLVSHPAPVGEPTFDLCRTIVGREDYGMERLSGWFETLMYDFKGRTDKMIMTIPELSGLAHIPAHGDVQVDGITWTDIPVEGTLPPTAQRFTPLTEEEKKKQREGSGSDTPTESTPYDPTADFEIENDETDTEGDSEEPNDNEE